MRNGVLTIHNDTGVTTNKKTNFMEYNPS